MCLLFLYWIQKLYIPQKLPFVPSSLPLRSQCEAARSKQVNKATHTNCALRHTGDHSISWRVRIVAPMQKKKEKKDKFKKIFKKKKLCHLSPGQHSMQLPLLLINHRRKPLIKYVYKKIKKIYKMKMSYVRCHVSGVRCQLSDVTYHLCQQPQPQPQTLPLLNIPTLQKQNKKPHPNTHWLMAVWRYMVEYI